MLIYLVIVNVISFTFMGYDKYASIKKKERIPEIVLISLSFLGGSILTLLSMYIFRHKTKKLKFKLLIPISLLLTILIIIKSSL